MVDAVSALVPGRCVRSPEIEGENLAPEPIVFAEIMVGVEFGLHDGPGFRAVQHAEIPRQFQSQGIAPAGIVGEIPVVPEIGKIDPVGAQFFVGVIAVNLLRTVEWPQRDETAPALERVPGRAASRPGIKEAV